MFLVVLAGLMLLIVVALATVLARRGRGGMNAGGRARALEAQGTAQTLQHLRNGGTGGP